MSQLVLVIALVLPAVVHADSGRSDFLSNLGGGLSKKADEKYQNRWTIADWFETQRKTRLQDMWLAANKSDDLYEFMVGGQSGSSTLTNDGVEQSTRVRETHAHANAYATFVGLEGEYTDMADEGWGRDGLVALRLLGDSQQNTNLTLFYGVRYRVDTATGEDVQNQIARGRLTLYINKAVGIEGFYQLIFKGTSSLGADIEGSRAEASAFLDFGPLRVYGAGVREFRARTLAGAKSERLRESIDFGLKLYF